MEINTTVKKNIWLDKLKDESSEKSIEENYKTKKIIYLVAIVIWILLMIFLRLLFNSTFLSHLILIIPPVIFLINAFLPIDTEASHNPDIARGYIISYFFIIFSLFVNWQNPIRGGSDPIFKRKMVRVIVTSFILLMLSIVNFFPSQQYSFAMSQIDSIFNIMSICLIVYTVIEFVDNEYS